MRVRYLLDGRRRAVSPVIATILLITIAIAGVGVVSVLYSNIGSTTPSADTNVSLGSSSGQSIWAEASVIKLSTDPVLSFYGIKDYSTVTIQLDYYGPASSIYILDIDILVYGEKLDDLSKWQVDSANGASATYSNGLFTGYQQSKGSIASYVVKLENINNSAARIPTQTTFSYSIKYGVEQGKISGIITKERISKIIFDLVFYNVSLFHYGSINTPDSAAYQFANTLTSPTLNGTNKMYFLYDQTTDAFDYSQPLPPVLNNLTRFSELYNIVIVDKWAVPDVISTQLLALYNLGTNLIFYGGLSDLGANVATINGSINYPITETITGLVPNINPGTISGSGTRGTDNSYSFINQNYAVLLGLSGKSFAESECCPNIGDEFAYDSAILSTNTTSLTVFGWASYDLFKGSTHYWTNPSSPLLINKARSNNTGNVYTFTWKHNEDLASGQSSVITDQGHLSRVRTNMLGAVVSEVDRLTNTDSAVVSIDTLRLPWIKSTGAAKDRQFQTEITASVTSGSIVNGTLTITLDMPNILNFSDVSGNTDIKAVIDDGVTSDIITNIPFTINNNDNTINVNIGANYGSSIIEGSTITIYIPDGKNIEINEVYTTEMTWNVIANYDSVGYATQSFSIAINSSIDFTPPAQVTGLSATAVSSSQIDLSWTANSEGDIDYYNIYRNSINIAQTAITTFNDTGLPGSTTNNYTVSAVDTSTNEGPQSTIASDTTLDGTPPAQVTGLNALNISDTQIDLTWNANLEPDLDHYNIYRNGTQIAQVLSGVEYYNDTGRSPDTTYSYQVSAVDNTSNEGQNSSIAIATTNPGIDVTPPGQVTGLSTTVISAYQIDLSWTVNGEIDLDHYRIYRDGFFLTTTTINSFSDTSLNESTLYSYEVSAVDSSNNEGTLSVASAQTTWDTIYASVLTMQLYKTTGQGGKNKWISVDVTVVDNFNSPVSGVLVTITLTNPAGTDVTLSDTTDANGQVTIDFGNSGLTGQYTATLDDLAIANHTFDSSSGLTSDTQNF